jgi:hypothetical protein
MNCLKRLVSFFTPLGLVAVLCQSIYCQPPTFLEEEKAYQAALQYIEEYRKSDVSIKVLDQAGTPVEGVTVNYRQTTHDFAFGVWGEPWATPSDFPLRWIFFDWIDIPPYLIRPNAGQARMASGENSRSGDCLHVKVSREQKVGIISEEIPIDPGIAYDLSFWIKVVQAPPPGASTSFAIDWAKGGSGIEPQPLAWKSIAPTLHVGDYVRLTVKGTAPAGANRAIFEVMVNAPGEGLLPADVEFYLDDVSFVRVGSSQNLMPNPGFEESEAKAWEAWSELCQSIGAWVLLDLETWPSVQPQRGVFHWEAVDWEFERILDHWPGARFIVMFDDLGCCKPEEKNPPWNKITELRNPLIFDQFKEDLYDYICHAAERYADRVSLWLGENELNDGAAQGLLGSIPKAVELADVVVRAIRDTVPTARILLGGSAVLAPTSPVEFARKVLQADVPVDGFAFQVYPLSVEGTPVFYQNWIRELAAFGKEVFVQEVVYAGVPIEGCPECWPTWGGIHDEPTQAAWVKYMVALAYGTQGAIGVLYDNVVDGDTTYAVRYSGLATRDGHTRLAYDAFRECVAMFTTSGTATSDEEGEVAFRGFAGNYAVSVAALDGRKTEETIHISEGKHNEISIVLPES